MGSLAGAPRGVVRGSDDAFRDLGQENEDCEQFKAISRLRSLRIWTAPV